MNCPVCKNDLSLPDKLKETTELHYDCPNCFSSLFLKGGGCEVLSRGTVSDALPAVAETEETGDKTPPEGAAPFPAVPDSDGGAEQESVKPLRDRSERAAPETDPPPPSGSATSQSEGRSVEEALPDPPEVPVLPEALSSDEEMAEGSAPPSEEADLSSVGKEGNPKIPKNIGEAGASAGGREETPESFEFAEEAAETAGGGAPSSSEYAEEAPTADGVAPPSPEFVEGASENKGVAGLSSPEAVEETPEHNGSAAPSAEFAEEAPENKGVAPLSATNSSVPETAPSEEKQEPPEEQDREEDFSDVEKFGNSPVAKGTFYYNVIVEEMDSEDLRAGVKEVLEDPALKLNPEQTDMSPQDGRLRVNKISPVQAHVIVKSLLGLSLKISWEQQLVADTPVEEAPR